MNNTHASIAALVVSSVFPSMAVAADAQAIAGTYMYLSASQTNALASRNGSGATALATRGPAASGSEHAKPPIRATIHALNGPEPRRTTPPPPRSPNP